MNGSPVVRQAFLALGSNLGDRWANLRAAVAVLPDVASVSSVYETEPVGGPSGQGAYLNCVVELSTSKSPQELLAAGQAAEAAAKRVREVHWGPRTLDVDVLLVGDLQVDSDDLVVPHPRMWERGFVLIPLAELAPEVVGARLGPSMHDGVRRVGSL